MCLWLKQLNNLTIGLAYYMLIFLITTGNCPWTLLLQPSASQTLQDLNASLCFSVLSVIIYFRLSHWACRAKKVNTVLCENCHIRKRTALQLPTKAIQRWNPEDWHGEQLSLCSYLLAEQSCAARCHMAPGYTARHSPTNTPHACRNVGVYHPLPKHTSAGVSGK